MTEKVDLWMPLYIGDYQRDTMRLSTTQHGAYLLLLMEYWIEAGPLPDDDDDLAAITKLPLKEWKRQRSKLARFFTLADGYWYHSRVEGELERAKKRRETARNNGKNGGRPRKNQNPEETQPVSETPETETQEKPSGFSAGSDWVSENPHFQNPEKSSSPSPSQSPSNTPPPGTNDPPSSLRSEGVGDDLPYAPQTVVEFNSFGGAK